MTPGVFAKSLGTVGGCSGSADSCEGRLFGGRTIGFDVTAVAGGFAGTLEFVEPCTRAIEFSLTHLLHEQAVFFAERLVTELPAGQPGSDEALQMLAIAHLRGGDVSRAHCLLVDRGSADPRLRYLLAHCCLRLDKPDEAERALLTANHSSTSFAYADLLQDDSRSADSALLGGVAGGAAGLFLLGQARERLRRPRECVVRCYAKCLEICPFMWCAFERLSSLSLGCASDSICQSTASVLSPRAFAETYLSEDRIANDPVLHPALVARTSPSGCRLDSHEQHVALDEIVEHSPSTAAGTSRKRRRSDGARGGKPPHGVFASVGSGGCPTPRANTCAAAAGSPSFRIPLADRSISAAGTTPAQQPPSPPADLPAAVAVPLLSRLSPRRLLSSPFSVPSFARFGSQNSPRAKSPPAKECGTRDGRSPPSASRLNNEDPCVGRDKNSQQASCLTMASLLQALGEAVHALHKYSCTEALEALESLPPSQRSSAFAQNLLGRCYFEMSDYGRATEVYSHCCEVHKPHRALGVEFYSTALWHLRDEIALGKLAHRLVKWDRLQPQVWCVVGNSFSLQREHEQAVRCFRRAIQIDPTFAYAYSLIGHEYTSIEQFDQAIQMYERAIRMDSRHYNAWWGLGNVYYRQEEYAKAKHHFYEACGINTQNAVLRISLGMACQSLGESERSLALFSAAAASGQCNAMASLQKGSALSEMGRYSEAVEELRRAQGLAPREPCVQYQLGRAHAGSGDAQRALLHFTMALDLCGSGESSDHQLFISAQAELVRFAALQQRDSSAVETESITEDVSPHRAASRQRLF
eukprot:TRINITY_DN32962_c0_g1_i1.p1 TRINITY_DN32962_c0_g1~~TRINITY_DN32962_c0_g1_i1.p1  ORF type:complete len:827 (+),score=93.61 TRINITY_DN32962_c0_g1_i1:50-2482(+)